MILKTHGARTLLFPSLIIESGQFFTIKLLVLHPENNVPIIKSVGKIASIQSISIREAFKDKEQESFFNSAFRGGFFVQITRIIAYALTAILLLVTIIAPSAFISSKLEKRKRTKSVEEFKGLTKLDLNESDEFIFTHFINGTSDLGLMHSLISNPDKLDAIYIRYRKKESQKKQYRGSAAEDRYDQDFPEFLALPHMMWLKDWIEAGVIKETKNGLVANVHPKDTLTHFLRFLKNKGLAPLEVERIFGDEETELPDEPDKQ